MTPDPEVIEFRGAPFEKAAEALAQADRVLVSTGAGVSAESGVPTFRASDGLWENYRLEEVATPDALQRNPRLVWEFYEMRRRNMSSVEPNAGHRALVEMERLFSVTVVTQNIDGLHQRAGATEVHEVHGSLWSARCLEGCGHREDPFPFPAKSVPPTCVCGGILRPDVVLFGEMLPERPMSVALSTAASCDVALVAGTSSVVWPAAGIPLQAKEAGAFVIEVNPEPTELTQEFDVSLRGPSGSVLPDLVRRVEELRS